MCSEPERFPSQAPHTSFLILYLILDTFMAFRSPILSPRHLVEDISAQFIKREREKLQGLWLLISTGTLGHTQLALPAAKSPHRLIDVP